jgi:uncharacterized protein (UPF0261 family)
LATRVKTPSVTDLAGPRRRSKGKLANGGGAIVGMLSADVDSEEAHRPLGATSLLGVQQIRDVPSRARHRQGFRPRAWQEPRFQDLDNRADAQYR